MSRRSYVRPSEVAIPFVLVIAALVAGGIAVPGFLSSGHLSSMSIIASYIGIIAIGQTLVLLLGGIDLSVPYVLNFVAVVMVELQSSGVAGVPNLAIALAVGLAAGLLNGFGVAFLGVSPLVMTLGMNSILQGAALIYSGGSPLGTAPGFVGTLSTGVGGIPYAVMLWIVLLGAVSFMLVFTRFGRSIYAVGANPRTSRLSGLPVKRTTLAAYAISGLSAGLGGVLLVGYSGQAYLGMGDSYLLPSIAVVVIGGTSVLGGKGSYVQTVAGALAITVIESAIVSLRISQSGQDMLYGGVILLMTFFNQAAVAERTSPRARRWQPAGPLKHWLQPVDRRKPVRMDDDRAADAQHFRGDAVGSGRDKERE